jgi:hypothetical protein
VRALECSQLDVKKAALEGLTSLGATASAALPRVLQLASCHYSAGIRKQATTAAAGLGALPPENPSCPSSGYEADGWTVSRQGKSWQLRKPGPVEVPRSCKQASAKLRGEPLGVVGDACVVGVNHGEFGGALYVVNGAKTTKLRENPFLNPVAIVKIGNEILLVDGLEHLSGSRGGVARISGDAGRTWEFTPLTELPAFPFAWALDGLTLLVAVRETEDTTPCREVRARDKYNPLFAVPRVGEVLRIAERGMKCSGEPEPSR